MKSILASILIIAGLIQGSYSFVAPCHKQGLKQSATALSLFGNNKSQAKAKPTAQKKKVNAPKEKKPMWQKVARVVVTGSPDGISLLGKPQHNWVTGKPMSKPAGHSWTASYKKSDKNNKK